MSGAINPGSTLGVLGSGQLGRMFAIAARQLGYRVHVYSPEKETPAGAVADREFQGEYDDLDTIREFAGSVDVVTFEFENVPAPTARACEELVPVRPGGSVLHISQNRLREKSTLQSHGLPVTPFVPVHSTEELASAIASAGGRGVLKTASWGYDGKGQIAVKADTDVDVAWTALKTDEGILETFIDFDCELSVVGVRGLDGSFVSYGPLRNEHHNHILDVTSYPSLLPEKVCREAVEITREVLESLDVVGVLCVEFFLTRDQRLLINETAPRPHNSGHLTIDANVTSQFEQQVRAICGLPLGSADSLGPAAMANLLGNLWSHGQPRWVHALSDNEIRLHLYGKADPRPGRKMGHLTCLGTTVEEAISRVRTARKALLPEPP
ncbi:MAG: 5-(carboxyamino)imidazole ribonucleotide synthase [Planctomycetaceae bacterium]|nr:5-(carboxyamino)imidazole ribonucleotide synthase [Planctomycetaceae bacterium]